MGIQINGNNDIISALDGSWTAEGASINTSGILTATTFKGNIVGTAATFTGPVTIGGTLTYEDVTNIDSVGLITARDGVFIPDTKELKLGNTAASPDLKLYSTGTNGWVYTQQSGADLYMGTNAGEVYIQTGTSGNDTAIKVNNGGAVELNYGTSKKFETTNLGARVVGDLQMGNTVGVRFHHTGTTSIFETQTAGDHLIFKTTPTGGSTTERLRIYNSGKVSVAGEVSASNFTLENDTGKLVLGTGSDLQLFHDGGSSIIRNTNNNSSLYLQGSSSGTNNIRMYANGGTHLYWNGELSLYTAEDAVRIHDDVKLKFGNASDLEIYHNAGAHNYLSCVTGGSDIIFKTTPSGGSTAERIRITSAGNLNIGTNGTYIKENQLYFKASGAAYIDQATTGQDITIRTSNSSSLDTTAMFIKGDGRVQVYCLNNARGLELNVGSNAGSLVFDRNGRITSFIRASDGGSNVAGASGGGSRVYLNKEYIQWFTFPYTTNIGDAPTYTERMRLWNGGLVVGNRVGTSNPTSNQPVAFHSSRVNPDGADANVHTAQRCNLYVGSNSGWAAGDGGVLGLGGSGTGSAGQERMWAYVKGSRQSGNGWEYGGYLDLGTANWTGNTTGKKMRIWSQGQCEWFPTDNTMMSWKVGGAQRMKFTHTGGGNIEIDNSNGTMTYDTGSDYRLKKDEVAITDALTTVKALKPYQFTYKSDNRLGQGFFAHEAQAVLPDVGIVSGTKDAVHAEDDTEKGNWKKDDPIYQQIDYSKLVPLLTAAIKELEARVASLESS